MWQDCAHHLRGKAARTTASKGPSKCSMQVLYSFDSGRSLLSIFLGQGDLSQLIAVVNGTNDGSMVRPFVLGFGR